MRGALLLTHIHAEGSRGDAKESDSWPSHRVPQCKAGRQPLTLEGECEGRPSITTETGVSRAFRSPLRSPFPAPSRELRSFEAFSAPLPTKAPPAADQKKKKGNAALPAKRRASARLRVPFADRSCAGSRAAVAWLRAGRLRGGAPVGFDEASPPAPSFARPAGSRGAPRSLGLGPASSGRRGRLSASGECFEEKVSRQKGAPRSL